MHHTEEEDFSVWGGCALSVAGCVDEQTGCTCRSLPVPGGD